MLSGEELRQLRIIHLALCVGCLMLLGVFGMVADKGPVPFTPEQLPAFRFIGPASLGLLVVSFALFRKKVASLGSTRTLAADLRAALILHWALIEFPCLFNALQFYLTGHATALGYAGVALGILALRHPTPARVQRWSTGQP